MVIKQVLTLLVGMLLLVTMTSCGLLYTNVVRQHSKDYNNTPIGSKICSSSAYAIRIPLLPATRQRVQAQWDTNEIKDIAQEAGITRIHFTDLRTQEFLLGTFRRQTIIIYGD